LNTGTVGAIAVSESDPNIVVAGMGEHAARGVMTSMGDGVYKSMDAGKTWTHIGLDKSRHRKRCLQDNGWRLDLEESALCKRDYRCVFFEYGYE